jgi:hypothetical protein
MLKSLCESAIPLFFFSFFSFLPKDHILVHVSFFSFLAIIDFIFFYL